MLKLIFQPNNLILGNTFNQYIFISVNVFIYGEMTF